MSELKAKTVDQVIETIINKVEKYSGKTMTKDERDTWHDWLDDQAMELHRRFTKDTLEMIPKIKFTNR